MSNVGFSELVLLALVGLLVVGPRRMPEVARFLGHWTRQARGAWSSLKKEFEAELQDEMDRDHNRRILEAEQQGLLSDTPTDPQTDPPIEPQDEREEPAD